MLQKASAKLAGTSLDATVTTQPGLVRVRINPTRNGTAEWSISFKPTPKADGVSIRDLKARQATPSDPVVLTWQGNTMFYQVSRDGTVISSGHYGNTLQDSGAPAGKSVTYSIRPVDGPAQATATASVTLTTKEFKCGPTPPQPVVSLSTLKPASAQVGHGTLQSNKSVNGTPLTLSGTTYRDGIGFHSVGEISYLCKPEWKQFVATVGLDDSQRHDPRASIVCSVTATLADGTSTIIAKTPVLAVGKTMQWNMHAAVPAGTTRVTLRTDDAGDGINCDHSDWVNAGFLTN